MPVKNHSFIKKNHRLWLPPILGAIGGVIYATVDEELVNQLFHVATPRVVIFAHDVVDFVLPVVFGIMVGLAINVLRRQKALNQSLSLQNSKLQRDLLVNTLISLFLHEIRNPIHNVAAALDDTRIILPSETGEIINRNLKRLEEITVQYRKWGSSFELINPKEKTELQPWLKDFIENKVGSRLDELDIDFSEKTDSVWINMHPLLLDQSFTTLFTNACDALAKEPKDRKLRLVVHLQPPHYKKVAIQLINHGRGFSKETLKSQGHSPSESTTGLGVGLTLLRKVLDQVDGELSLANFEGYAEVALLIPGEPK